jgi:phospholipid transport system substrate-binding protein
MIKKYAFCLLISVISTSIIAADYSSPTGRIEDSVNKIISVLKDKSMDSETNWDEIGLVIKDSFDFRSMSQSVLATNWKKASPEERQQFVVFFTQHLEDVYKTKIEAYTKQKVEYAGETIRGKRAVVETLIITDSSEISIYYKLKNNDGIWFAYDVVIEGISLVNNYRSTFAAIVKNDGMNGLLNREFN